MTNPSDIPATPEATAEAIPTKRLTTSVLVAILAAALVVLLATGAFAVVLVNTFLGKGQSATASAVAFPANTVSWAELAIDPSNSQKLEALRVFDEISAVKDAIEESDLDIDLDDPESNTDIRKTLWDFIVEGDDSTIDTDLDYDDDVKPWIGSRVAFGVLPIEDAEEGIPLIVAIETRDAKAGVAAVEDFVDDLELDDLSVSSRNGYVLIGTEGVDLEDAFDDGTLADTKSFAKATASAGEWGILAQYTDYGAYLGTYKELLEGEQSEALDASLKQLEGVTGFTLMRFVDGAIEVSGTVTGIKDMPDTNSVGNQLAELPDSTLAAVSLAGLAEQVDKALSDDNLTLYSQLYGLASPYSGFSSSATDSLSREDVVDYFDEQLGIDFPEDLSALFGKKVLVSVDGELDPGAWADADSSAEGTEDFVGSGIAITIVSDDPDATVEAWEDLIDTVEEQMGDSIGVDIEQDGSRVVISAGDYLDSVLKPESRLGRLAEYDRAVPRAAGAYSVIYLNAESFGDLVDELSGSDDFSEYLDGIEALGVTTTIESADTSSFLLRITTTAG